MSEWVETHLPCPKCGSSDAYSINDKGWGKCFSCDANVKEGDEPEQQEPRQGKKMGKANLIPFGEIRPFF